jgi:hypothetical protein
VIIQNAVLRAANADTEQQVATLSNILQNLQTGLIFPFLINPKGHKKATPLKKQEKN